MTALTLRLFGAPRLEREGRVQPIETRKALALLAYLAVTGRVQERSVLAALLWPESDPERARGALRRTLVPLRKLLGAEALETRKETIALRGGGAGLWVDAVELDRLLNAGDAGAETDFAALGAGTALYEDDFLAGFSLRDAPEFDQWQRVEGERLRGRTLGALERLVRHHQERGEGERAIALARRRLALDPLDEVAQGQLMELLARAGRRGEAISLFEICARQLREELGAASSPETSALVEAIRDGRMGPPTLVSAKHPAKHLIPVSVIPPNATVPTSGPEREGFVGRGAELEQIGILLRGEPPCRLLSLLGPGGVGKSTLAARAASREEGTFPDGVCFVPLAGLDSPENLAQEIAEALGLPLLGHLSPREQLLAALAGRQALLVLDNFETLLASEAAVGLVPDLLRYAPRLQILVTSRERLNLEAEWCFEVAGLASPPTDDSAGEVDEHRYPAVALFLAHARRARPDLPLGSGSLRQVAELCRLTEGLPLALELAAPWVRVLPLPELVARVAQGLDLLSSGRRDLPERHRSMRAVFEESWLRLTPGEQDAFRALTVCAGGFGQGAAGAVAGADLPLLASLVDRSFLKTCGDGRYEVHELLRQFGREKLDEEPEAAKGTRHRHALHFAAFLAERREAIRGRAQQAALAEIAVELDNVRAAWRYLIEEGVDAELQSAEEALFHFFEIGCRFHEGERAFEAARRALLRREGEAAGSPAWQGALRIASLCAASFHLRLGDYDRARSGFEAARRIAFRQEPDRADGLALIGLAHAATVAGDYEAAWRAAEVGAAILRKSEEPWDRAIALHALGEMAYGARRPEAASRLFAASLEAFREIGDRRMEARVLLGQARVAYFSGESREARRLFEQGLALCRELDDRWGAALCLQRLGAVAHRAGDLRDARSFYSESLALSKEIGDRRGRVVAQAGIAQIVLELDGAEAAREPLRQAVRLAQEIGSAPLLLAVLVAAAPVLAGPRLAGEILDSAQRHPALTKETRRAIAELEEKGLTPREPDEPKALEEMAARLLEGGEEGERMEGLAVYDSIGQAWRTY